MFNRMDPNGNGFIEKQEFEDYMLNNDIALGVERISQLFETIKNATQSVSSEAEDFGITYQDLIKYFETEESVEAKEGPININIKNITDMEQYFAAANLTGANLCQDSLTVMSEGLR